MWIIIVSDDQGESSPLFKKQTNKLTIYDRSKYKIAALMFQYNHIFYNNLFADTLKQIMK